MKRLLTYGLLLLTILASHFVVSACQDDLPETTDIMVTFTTRAISGGTASTAPEIEQMHDLRVIMLRSDGTIVDMDDYKPEDENLDFNPSSVKFTFSTTIPNPEGEDFTFLAIANEESIDETLPWSTRGIGDKLTQSEIESITVDTDIKSEPIPQTDYWTVHVPQSNYKIDDRTLQFAGSKISVVFNNMTKEEQSLSNIHITGITPNTQGYLFKQDGADYIDSKLTDNGNAVSTISFGNLTLAAPTTVDGKTTFASDSVSRYTYPLGEGNISSPMLYADWNGEQRELSLNRIKDKEGNEIDFTSLSRNEHLRIEITLTPAGDITVNYTIAEWEETPTNIGDTAPTTPENGYHVEGWGDVNDIIIGGGEAGENDWVLSNGTVIKGEQIEVDWTGFASDKNDQLRVYIPNDKLIVGNRVVLDFLCAYNNCGQGNNFKIRFSTDQYSEQSIEPENSAEDVTYEYDEGTSYVRYLTLTESVIGKLHRPDWGAPNDQNDNYKVLILLTYDVNCDGADKFGVTITKFGLITPRSTN